LRPVAALCLLAAIDSRFAHSSPAVDLRPDGALSIGGRSLRCGDVRNVLDPRLPNLGVAAPGVLVINPFLLKRQPGTVRLFVFHHECGHHHVGASELGADCWAVKQGVRQGWLDRPGLAQVCRSFGNRGPTATHPSSASRCAALEQCFANATSVTAKSADPAVAKAGVSGPKLISGPSLLRNGVRRAMQ
jgi:hypothetical protein